MRIIGKSRHRSRIVPEIKAVRRPPCAPGVGNRWHGSVEEDPGDVTPIVRTVDDVVAVAPHSSQMSAMV